MKIIVLLSAGLHPVSGRPCPVPVELQAAELAQRLLAATETPGQVTGLHAGAVSDSVRDCLGHGLSEILVLEQSGDPVPALADAIREAAPDLVLAGRRGRGGEDSGMLPYLLAASLGWPMCADAAALAPLGQALAVTQALPRGARRRVIVRLPALVTVHPSAPASSAFAFATARQGTLRLRAGRGAAGPERPAPVETPYRKRPLLVRGVKTGGSAEDRLKAATEISGGGRVMVDPAPEEAAEAICAFLQTLGLIASGEGGRGV